MTAHRDVWCPSCGRRHDVTLPWDAEQCPRDTVVTAIADGALRALGFLSLVALIVIAVVGLAGGL